MFTTLPTDAQIDRIRETIRPTIEEWMTDYGVSRDKSHGQLENRIVAAIVAMQQSGVITINHEAKGPEGGV